MQFNKLTRREMLRLTAGLTTGAIAGPWLAACAPAATTGSGEGGGATAERVSVRIQASAIPNALKHTKWAADLHMEANPNVEIVVEETIYGEIAKKTKTGFVAGTLQDVCYGHMRWYFMGCHKGIYMSLEDYIASNPPPDFEDFFPRWMEVNKFEGVQYQLPHYSKPGPVSSLIYNKQLLEEAGVDEPTEGWSWLDMMEAAIQCTDEENGIFGINYRFLQNDIHSTTNVCRYFEEDNDDDNSGSLMVDGTTFRMDTDTIQEAMNYTLSLAHEHRAFPLAGDAVEGGLFAAGKLAFEVGQVVNNYIANLQRVGDRFEIGHVVSPQGPKGARGTVNVGNQWMINSKSEVKDEAWEFLATTMTSKEACIQSALEGIEPGRRSAWVDPEVEKVTPMLAKSVHLMDDYLEDFPMPSNLRYVEANSVFRNEVALIMEGEVTFDEYMPTVVEEVQAIVDLERPAGA